MGVVGLSESYAVSALFAVAVIVSRNPVAAFTSARAVRRSLITPAGAPRVSTTTGMVAQVFQRAGSPLELTVSNA